MGFDGRTIHNHGCHAYRVRWELVSRIKCSKSRIGDRRQAAGAHDEVVVPIFMTYDLDLDNLLMNGG